jgi:hypothetical protein
MSVGAKVASNENFLLTRMQFNPTCNLPLLQVPSIRLLYE